MTDVWREVPGFSGYEVSDCGQVRSWRTNGAGDRRRVEPRALNIQTDHKGYKRVEIAGRVRKVHHLVLEAFVGPRPDGMQAAHSNGNQADNRLENLRWATQGENCADKVRHGTSSRGESQGSSKLTEWDVRNIRGLWALHKEQFGSGRRIAAMFGTTASNISSIVNRQTWSHI